MFCPNRIGGCNDSFFLSGTVIHLFGSGCILLVRSMTMLTHKTQIPPLL
ncbi:hypothetical protein ATORI0001_0973 [Lancefieldella rimae ATCC 49626]|uniref:Uncharacterized protein n=1 Tax=Lancefieldella rimae (strain ATCC 49626 / DSM 7090 / CCUG 31168 / NBRC 15546 / VPI D140H-11A) TaxID=553184 RepID=B9CN14_LANR4|nr:hypothetical protein ATORI0001_0973 [Lancefieldella rimae ATCC 49626]